MELFFMRDVFSLEGCHSASRGGLWGSALVPPPNPSGLTFLAFHQETTAAHLNPQWQTNGLDMKVVQTNLLWWHVSEGHHWMISINQRRPAGWNFHATPETSHLRLLHEEKTNNLFVNNASITPRPWRTQLKLSQQLKYSIAKCSKSFLDKLCFLFKIRCFWSTGNWKCLTY